VQNIPSIAGELLAKSLGNFATFSPAEAAAIRDTAAGTPLMVEAGRDIVEEGAQPRWLNLISAGWACRYKMLSDGRRQILGFLLPGDLFDLNNHLIDAMDHSIGAVTRVSYVQLSHQSVAELMRQHARVGDALRWQQLVSLAIQREWTMNMGQRLARERLAHLFCELFERLQSVGLAAPNRCELPVTQNDLADAMGLTAVHINRTLQQLRASGAISLSSRMLTIADFDLLKNIAMFTPDYLHRRGTGGKGRFRDPQFGGALQ
jgi:CRP-like cAMP-binding protein